MALPNIFTAPDDLSAQITDLSRSYAGLNESPGLLFAAATSTDPDRTAQEIDAFRKAVITQRRLESWPDRVQMDVYGGLSEGEQLALDRIGYVVPHRKPENRWWVKFVGRPVGFVVSETLGNVVEFGNKAFTGGIGALGQAWRARELVEREELRRQGRDPWRETYWGLPGPSQFLQAWRRAGNEPDMIPFADELFARFGLGVPERLRGPMIDAAKGFSEAEIIDIWGQQGAEAIADPHFERARLILADHRLSFGQSLAASMSVDPGSDAFRYLSGTGDAIFTLALDPFLIAGKVNKAQRLAGLTRRTIQEGAKDVYRLSGLTAGVNGNREVMRATRRISEITQGDRVASQMLVEFPYLSPFVDEFAQAGPMRYEDVVDLLAGKAAALNTAAGRAGQYRVQVSSGVLQDMIGRARTSDTLVSFAQALSKNPLTKATMVKPLRQLSSWSKGAGPRGFNALDPKATAEVVRPLARILNPREAENIVEVWSKGDFNTRRTLWAGFSDDLRKMVGDHPEVSNVLDQMARSATDAPGTFQRFGSGLDGRELGVFTDQAGNIKRAGLYDGQITSHNLVVPDVDALLRAAALSGNLRRMVGRGHIPPDLVARMGGLWKRGKVFTFVQGARQGAEEILGYMLQFQAWPTIQAALGKRAITALRKMEQAEAEGARFMVKRLRMALATGEAALAGERAVFHASRNLKTYGAHMVPSLIDPHNEGVLDTAQTMIERVREPGGGKVRNFKMVPGKGYTRYDPSEDFVRAVAWQKALEPLNSDSSLMARTVISNPGNEAAALDAFLRSPDGSRFLSESDYFKHLEGLYGANIATQRFAQESSEAIRALYSRPDGTRIDDIYEALVKGETPSIEAIAAVGVPDQPLALSAQTFAEVDDVQGLAALLQAKGFGVMNAQMNHIARAPMFLGEQVKAEKRLKGYRAWLDSQLSPSQADDLFFAAVDDLAAREVYRWVDDPEVKSFFTRQHNAIFPFFNAYQQFIERWAIRLVQNPETARRAMLLLGGLESSGFVERDDQGALRFHYPVIGWGFDVLSRGLLALTGKNAVSGVPIDLTGTLQYVIPGAADPLRPGVGPLISIAYDNLKAVMPEVAKDAFEQVAGERGAQRPLWEQLAPTIAVNVLRPIVAAKDDAYLASAVNQAIAFNAANGRDLPDNATPEQVEAYIEEIRDGARMIAVLRGMLSLGVPGGVRARAAESLNPEFRELLRSHDVLEALRLFLVAHPGADAYTVFSSATVEGARRPLAATEEAGEWLRANDLLVQEYGAAATWLMPEAPGDFDPGTYRDQVARHLRRRYGPTEFWEQMKLVPARRVYYEQRDAFIEAMREARGFQKRDLQERWAAFDADFRASHPLLDKHIREGGLRQQERRQTVGRLWQALGDERVVDSPYVTELRQLVQAYLAFQVQRDSLTASRSRNAVNGRKVLSEQMVQIGQNLTTEAARSFFAVNIRPDLDVEDF